MATKKKATRKTSPSRAPLGTAEVTTPETPQQPTGYLWDRLNDARSPKQLDELKAHATAHGYHPDGQFMKALSKRMEG